MPEVPVEWVGVEIRTWENYVRLDGKLESHNKSEVRFEIQRDKLRDFAEALGLKWPEGPFDGDRVMFPLSRLGMGSDMLLILPNIWKIPA